jgi:integrase
LSTAEGSVYRRKDGRWVAQYRDARGKVRYVYRKTRGEAKKALREALQDRDEGYVPPDKLTVRLYVEGWMEDRHDTVSARTWRVQESMLRNKVNPYIGDVRLCKLTTALLHRLGHHAHVLTTRGESYRTRRRRRS